jgi:raffinose/stachyose/melibiose transport system substrate-binding protein
MKPPLFLLAATTAVSLALALAGCSASDEGEGVRIEVQTNLGATDPILETLTGITDEFEAENPEITVDLVPSTDTYEADIKVRLASGDIPDVWNTHGWSLLRYQEFLEPLDGQPWAEHFNPALAAAMAEDDHFYALPFDTDIAGIVYSVAALEEAGVDPSALTDWNAFGDALEALKDAGITPISSSGKDSWFAGNVVDFMASGAFSDTEFEGFLAGEFQEAPYAALLDEIATWREADYFNPDYASATMDDLGRALAEGRTGFVMAQNYMVATALGFAPNAQLGYIPIPSDHGTPYLVGGEGRAFGVWKDSPNKEQALAYLDFLSQPENISAMATTIGAAPGLTNADSELGALQDSYDRFVAGGEYPLLPYFDRVYLPNGMWDTMVTTTDSIITGQAKTPDAVRRMSSDFSHALTQ